MKEAFMQMMEDGWNGSNYEYLQRYANTLKKDKKIYMPLPCPNCFDKTLLFNSTTDIKCESDGCGQEFTLVDANTIRYK